MGNNDDIMIFAMIDLTKYIFQLGKYDPNTLNKAGFKLASSGSFEHITFNDCIYLLTFHTRFSLFSWLIMWVTESACSHSAILMPGSIVFHAVSKGVVENKLEEILDGKSYISALMIPVEKGELDKILKFQKAQLGNEYNWSGAIKFGLYELLSLNGKFRARHMIDIIIVITSCYALVRFM